MKILKMLGIAAIVAVGLTAGSTANVNGNGFGDPKAKVVIEVFSDFQCPACKTFHDTDFKRIFTDYVATGKVYFIYRYFPLQGHQFGRRCADYVAAAARVGRYEKAWNAVFEKQQEIALKGNVAEVVASVLTPAEMKQVQALVSSPEVKKMIETDMAEGSAVPVEATPQLWVSANGKSQTVKWPINYPLFKSYVDTLLNK